MYIPMAQDITIKITLPKPPSLNEYYAGRHFAIRKKQGDAYKKIIKEKISEYDAYFAEGFELHIFYNSRFDCDNSILCAKFTADSLVDMGVVEDDSPKYFKSVRIDHDGTMEKNTYIAQIKLFNVTERDEYSEQSLLPRSRGKTKSRRTPQGG
jgi:hypothetical protein